jgi:sialidase-1
MMKFVSTLVILSLAATTFAKDAKDAKERQWVEGFDEVEFHHDANRGAAARDFRGMSVGYMTAGWWAPGQVKKNLLSWRTAAVPEKADTTFAFVAATSVLPSEITRGPSAKLTVNGKEALTFTLGFQRDFTWKHGEYELKFLCKRLEFPYFGPHRQLDLSGVSGIYQLTVPASAVEAGEPALIQVELPPDERWPHGWFMVKQRRDALKQSMQSLQGEVEALRQDVSVLIQQTHMLATRAYPELADATPFQHQVIYANGYRHLHPADLIRLNNGELLITTREATEHYSADGDVVMLRSKDGGQTWGDRQVIASSPLDEREGCGIQLKDGTIVVGIFYNNLYKPDGSYGFNWKKELKEQGEPVSGKRYLGSYTISSTDNGKTWSEPSFIDSKDMPYSELEGPTDAPIEMPDGSIVMGLIGQKPEGDLNGVSAVMVRSTDKGKTWKFLSTIAGDPEAKHGGFMEPGIIRTKTGRIIAGLRNHGPDQAIYTTYSDDDGKTWAPVQKTAMVGHPVDLIQLADGRVMASYGIRTPHARPMGIRACFSKDNGETWDVKTEVQIRKDFINWDVGYPESIELPDGRVLTVYYYNLFNKYFLGGTVWKP